MPAPVVALTATLLSILSVQKHEFFTREGDDIYYELPINFAQAALGTEVVVPTLEGDTKLKDSRRLSERRDFPIQE